MLVWLLRLVSSFNRTLGLRYRTSLFLKLEMGSETFAEKQRDAFGGMSMFTCIGVTPVLGLVCESAGYRPATNHSVAAR